MEPGAWRRSWNRWRAELRGAKPRGAGPRPWGRGRSRRALGLRLRKRGAVLPRAGLQGRGRSHARRGAGPRSRAKARPPGMARGVHAGAVSAVAGPGDEVGRELPPERWCGWSGRGGQPTAGQSGCPADPRGRRAGAARLAEARGRTGGYLRRTGGPRSRPAGTCGCLGAGPPRRPQRCGCAGPEAAGCGVSGAVRWGQLRCRRTGSGLCVKGPVGTEEQNWGPGGRESLGVNKGEGPWLLWPPLTPSPRCWGPQSSPLLTGLRHEAELGPDGTVHLPERLGHGHAGRGQTEASDRGQEAGGSLSHQIAQGRRLAHALYREAGRWDRV